MKPQVSIIMGSTSDLPVMEKACKFFEEMEIPFEVNALSAHRTPAEVSDFARNAAARGIRVIIAGAGMAAALPGVIAAETPLPVIGVPIKGSTLEGLDATLAILQMPPGIPVATVAINGAQNAAILAMQILALADSTLMQKLIDYKSGLKTKIVKANEELAQTLTNSRNNELTNSQMITIGITGTLGAGKGTIVDYLQKEKGFSHYSVRAFLIDEIKARGMEVNRDSMTLVGNDLRAQHSPSWIIEQLYQQAQASGKNCIIESIRTPGEVDALRSKPNFYLFAVDADPRVRYDRAVLRGSETTPSSPTSSARWTTPTRTNRTSNTVSSRPTTASTTTAPSTTSINR